MTRTERLDLIAENIAAYIQEEGHANLLFVCTHNSRRSIFAETWAKHYSKMGAKLNIFSAGTEATAVPSQVINTLKAATAATEGLSSKTIFDELLPKKNIIAIMVCDHANEACPHISGARQRHGLTYVDPKWADGTDQQTETYKQTSNLIAKEMEYLMNQIHGAV